MKFGGSVERGLTPDAMDDQASSRHALTVNPIGPRLLRLAMDTG